MWIQCEINVISMWIQCKFNVNSMWIRCIIVQNWEFNVKRFFSKHWIHIDFTFNFQAISRKSMWNQCEPKYQCEINVKSMCLQCVYNGKSMWTDHIDFPLISHLQTMWIQCEFNVNSMWNNKNVWKTPTIKALNSHWIHIEFTS